MPSTVGIDYVGLVARPCRSWFSLQKSAPNFPRGKKTREKKHAKFLDDHAAIVQFGFCAPGKAHMRCTPSLENFSLVMPLNNSNVGLIDNSGLSFKVERRVLAFFLFLLLLLLHLSPRGDGRCDQPCQQAVSQAPQQFRIFRPRRRKRH